MDVWKQRCRPANCTDLPTETEEAQRAALRQVCPERLETVRLRTQRDVTDTQFMSNPSPLVLLEDRRRTQPSHRHSGARVEPAFCLRLVDSRCLSEAAESISTSGIQQERRGASATCPTSHLGMCCFRPLGH